MNAKRKVILSLALGMAVMLPLVSFAKSHPKAAVQPKVASVTLDNQDVMHRIVLSSMRPIYLAKEQSTGTLMLSDSPEYPDADGILYSDEVKGKVRMYFYHVNQSNVPRKVVVMAYNPARQPVRVTLDHIAYSRPSEAYYTVGKELSIAYYETEPTVIPITVPADGYAVIGEKLDKVGVKPNELFSGLLDMTFPSRMTVSSVIMPVNEDPYKFIKLLKYLPSDSVHLRGTFHGSDRLLQSIEDYSTDSGSIGYVKLGDGIRDHFLLGRDALENDSAEDVGNYGVDYNVDVRTKGTGKIHIYFNTQGGAYAGVLAVRHDNQLKLVEVPNDPYKYNMGDNDAYAMQYVDTMDAGKEVTIHLMPPGAANLPVRIIFVPDKIARTIVTDVNRANAELAKVIATMNARKPATVTTTTKNGKKQKGNQQQEVQLQEPQQTVIPQPEVRQPEEDNGLDHPVDLSNL